MRGNVPEELVEHPDPEEVELGGEFLEWRHEVAVDTEVDVVAVIDVEDVHELHVLQVSVDGHVEVVEVGGLQRHQLLVELRVFLALLDDVRLAVLLVLHHLLRKIHRFD